VQELLLTRRNGTPHPRPIRDEEGYLLKEVSLILVTEKVENEVEFYLTGQVIAAYTVGNGLKPFSTKDLGLPVNGISPTQLASACCAKPRFFLIPLRHFFKRGDGS